MICTRERSLTHSIRNFHAKAGYSDRLLAKPTSWLETLLRWCRRNPERAFSNLLALLLFMALVIGGTWFSARLGSARKLADETAKRLGIEQFFAIVSGLQIRRADPTERWVDKNFAEIAKASPLANTSEMQRLLRIELLRCLCGHDIRVERTLLSGIDISKMALHPHLFGDNYPSALTTIRIPGVVGGNFLLPGGGQNGRRP